MKPEWCHREEYIWAEEGNTAEEETPQSFDIDSYPELERPSLYQGTPILVFHLVDFHHGRSSLRETVMNAVVLRITGGLALLFRDPRGSLIRNEKRSSIPAMRLIISQYPQSRRGNDNYVKWLPCRHTTYTHKLMPCIVVSKLEWQTLLRHSQHNDHNCIVEELENKIKKIQKIKCELNIQVKINFTEQKSTPRGSYIQTDKSSKNYQDSLGKGTLGLERAH